MRAVTLLAVGAVAACGPADHEGSCKELLIAGDLVITEVFADYQAPAGGTGADDGKEWIEIYNGAGRPVELRGLTVVHGRPDGSRQRSHVIDDVTIAPGQYFTIGNSARDLLPPYIDYGYGDDLGDLFNTGGGKLELRCGGATIDTATYDDVRPGRSRQLTAAQAPDYTVNDARESWCEAAETQFEPGNYGTPGQDNDCTAVIPGQCSEAGLMRGVVSPGPGDLVITEIMPSPSAVSDAVGEWFEVRVMRDVDLNGVGLDRAGDSMMPDLIEAADCLRVTAGSHVVFARDVDPVVNGGLPALGRFRFSLVGGSPTSPGDVQILSGATIVVDAVSWTSSRTSRSLSLDPDATDITANDDLANFCDGATPYNSSATGTDLGTPGAPNPQCPLQPQPGQCLDNGAPRAIVKPTPGQLVITELLPNPAGTGTDATQEWFEIKNTGATAFDLNGLRVTGPSSGNDIISAGCKTVPPGGYGLLARSADRTINGGLPAVDATFSFALLQSNGSVSVFDGATELDKVTWTIGIQDGVSKQLQPALTNTTANNDPANFCNALPTQTYGDAGNLGTPKAANACM